MSLSEPPTTLTCTGMDGLAQTGGASGSPDESEDTSDDDDEEDEEEDEEESLVVRVGV